jgi:hypothetical protein
VAVSATAAETKESNLIFHGPSLALRSFDG